MSAGDELQVLLQDCAAGDRSAMERLYRRAAPRLFAVCVHMLRRDDLAEEVLQEAFIQIWRDAPRFDPSRAKAMTWMAVIVRHRAIDLMRRQRRQAEIPDTGILDLYADAHPGPPERLLELARRQDLARCLAQLPPVQRRSIVLAFLRGLTHQELSHRLGTPLGTVKSWIRRGLGQLKRCLAP